MTALHKALVAALGEIKNPALDRENTHFRNRYATLASHVDAARTTLAKHKLAVIQPLRDGDAGRMVVDTTIIHESGETLTTSVSFVQPADPQKVGSAVTYFRRYALAAALGIVGEDDDDAEAAVGRGGNSPPARTQPMQSAAPKTVNQPKAAAVPEPKDGVKPGRWQTSDKVDSAAEVVQVSGIVTGVEAKSGVAKTGKEWTKYRISIEGGEEVGTFHASAAEMARRYQSAGEPMLAVCTRNAKGYLDVFEIDSGIPF